MTWVLMMQVLKTPRNILSKDVGSDDASFGTLRHRLSVHLPK
jgi:hypothetical protein